MQKHKKRSNIVFLTVSIRFQRLHETYETAQMISASARTCSEEATKQFSGRMDIANIPNVLFSHDTYLSIPKMHISFETQVCSLNGSGSSPFLSLVQKMYPAPDTAWAAPACATPIAVSMSFLTAVSDLRSVFTFWYHTFS